MQDEWKAGSDESDDSGEDSSEVKTESALAHKETVTVPTTTTPALPLEALGLQPAVATPRRVEPMEVKKVTRSATTTPPADATASTHENAENVGQVDGPAKSSDTTLKVTPSTSGTAGKQKKRG